MKTLLKTALTLSMPLLLLGAAGCGDDADRDGDRNELSDNVDIAADSLRDDASVNKDEEFVEDLMEMNAKTVALLKAGTTMGTDAQLKKDARTMLTDHEALATRLRGIASSKGFEMDDLGDEDSTTDAADNKRGAGWDDDWADDMVDRHQKMINRLEDYSDDTKDAELLGFINDARPKLASHLSMAEALAKRLDD